MSDLRPVTVSSSRTDRYVGRLIVVVVVAIVIAVAKPWGSDAPPPRVAAVPVATPTPTPSLTPAPSHAPRAYDFLAWGTNEPPPGWELWPAGTLSSFSFAMRIDVGPHPVIPADGSGVAIGVPSPGPSAGSSARVQAPAIPGTWPKVDIPAGSSLELVGVNHPIEYRVAIAGLFSLDADGGESALHAIAAPSPWPGHFMIVGLGSNDGSAGMEPWPTGRYRLDIVISPGEVERSIEIVVEPRPVRAGASGAPSDAPSAAP
jgi:hypothetical protein